MLPSPGTADTSASMNSINNSVEAVTPRVTRLLAAIGVGLFIYALLSEGSGFITIRDYSSHLADQLYFLGLQIWLPWVILSPLLVLFARRFPINPDNWLQLTLVHIFLFLGLSLLHVSAVSYHYHFFGDMNAIMATYQPWQHIGHFLFGDDIFLYNAIIYTIFMASFNLQNFYSIAQQRELESSQLNEKLAESKLQALRMQINPHFLFNTLNVISVLVMKQDNAKAGEMIERLSVFFRQTLEESSEQYLPLQQELDVIDQYLAIEELRFGDRLQIRRNFDPEALSALVPALILQPLVENAIRHGLGEKLDAGVLSLECKRVADRLLIRIIDDGVGCSFSTNTGFTPGIGLSNVQQRLQQMYGNDHVFNLSGETGQGVTVSIEIPFTRQDPGLAAQ